MSDPGAAMIAALVVLGIGFVFCLVILLGWFVTFSLWERGV